ANRTPRSAAPSLAACVSQPWQRFSSCRASLPLFTAGWSAAVIAPSLSGRLNLEGHTAIWNSERLNMTDHATHLENDPGASPQGKSSFFLILLLIVVVLVVFG